jgi:RNA polymerase sigma-70 factor (subfamily 1)
MEESVRVSGFKVLLQRARTGCRQALGVLFESYRDPLLDIARAELPARVRPKCGPSDFVQKTYLEAQRHLKQFTGKSQEEWQAWLRAILRNAITDVFRSYAETAKRELAREQRLGRFEKQLNDFYSQPDSNAIRREQEEAIGKGLESLDETSRRIVNLKFREGLSLRRIAVEVGCSKETARRKLTGALVELHDWMTGEHLPRENGQARL